MLARIPSQSSPLRRFWRYVHAWVQSDENSCATTRRPRCDRELADGQEPPLGAHLVTPRFGFVHHGIYMGGGKVMHCGAVSRILPRGPVEEVSLQCFSRGHPVTVRSGEAARYAAQVVIERARSRAGENRYRLFTNNCEHFCEWCLRGRHRSHQIERLARWLRPWGPLLADDRRLLG
jgi:Lecithin retinol acyltransferase